MTDATWFISLTRPGVGSEWDVGAKGAPDPRQLLPTRRPTSGDFSRHIPRRFWSATTGRCGEVESGLEHDLVRWVDHRRDVVHLVEQPVRFRFTVPGKRRPVHHTPDLLSQHADGTVTLWDARPASRVEDSLRFAMERTAAACREVGWSYELFTGLPTAKRMNLLWLHGYRRPVSWHRAQQLTLERLVDGDRTIGVIRNCNEAGGSVELLGTMWHLIAIGVIDCDLSRPMRDDTVLTWRGPRQSERDDEGGAPPREGELADERAATQGLRRRLLGVLR